MTPAQTEALKGVIAAAVAVAVVFGLVAANAATPLIALGVALVALVAAFKVTPGGRPPAV